MPRNPRRTRATFLETYGDGPWTCCWCGDEVTHIGQGTWDGNIHHKDENVENDDPSNLEIGHAICHQRHHGPPTEDDRRRISEKLRGRTSPTKGMRFSDEINAKKSRPGESNPFFGHKHTEETKAKMRGPRPHVTHSRPVAEYVREKLRGARPHQVCEDCGQDWAGSWIKRHKQEGFCKTQHKKQRERRVG